MAQRAAEVQVPRQWDRLGLVVVLLLLVCCGAWALNQVAVKLATPAMPPVLQAALRSVVAGLLVWLWMLWRRLPILERDGTLWAGIGAGLLFAFEFVAIYVGLQHTDASRSVIFVYSAPIVVAAGSHFLIAGDRLSLLKSLGLAAAFSGVVMALSESAGGGRPANLWGDVLCLIGGVMWGATTVLVRASRLARVSPEKTLLYQLAVSAAVLLPASFLMGETFAVEPLPGPLLWFLYTAVVVAFVSYLAWFWVIRHYPPSRAAAFTFLVPVFGVVAGALMLGELVTLRLGLALLLVAGGIWLINRAPSRA